MATQFAFSQVVTSGLVLLLDAADRNSYPGSGTVWRDMSGNGNNVTLTNGPTFSSANGGSIVFDGVDDYGNNNTPILPTGNISATICAWIYIVSGYTDQWQGIVGWGTRAIGQSFLLDMNAGRLAMSTWGSVGAQDLISTYNIPQNTWKFFVASIENRNVKLYADSVQILNSSISSTPNVTSTDLRLASVDYPGRLTNIRISNTQIYNRALSPSEVLQNYDAQKTRFNL